MNGNKVKKQIRVDAERMRYSVPGVCNRFWQVHTRFILACLLITVTAVVIAFSYSIIRSARKFEPKTVCVFFCTVDDYASIVQTAEKYSPFANAYFVEYTNEFAPDGEGAGQKYDFSRLGSEMSEYNQPADEILCVVLDASFRVKATYTYDDAGLSDGVTLTVGGIESILKEVTGV